MSYSFTKNINLPFEQAVERVTEALKVEGFGIISSIDVKKAMKSKLGVDFRNYKILGACNPPFAYKALLAEDKIGAMLPCNVIVQEHEDGRVEVSAVDPIASMQAVQNTRLGGNCRGSSGEAKKGHRHAVSGKSLCACRFGLLTINAP